VGFAHFFYFTTQKHRVSIQFHLRLSELIISKILIMSLEKGLIPGVSSILPLNFSSNRFCVKKSEKCKMPFTLSVYFK